MGPTCSIIYENEPAEKNIMLQKPRPFTTAFFNWRDLTTSIIQGLVITMGTLFIYQYAVQQGTSEDMTRTMVFITLISANIFLTLVNRSFFYSVIQTGRYKNNLIPIVILTTIILVVLLLSITPLRKIFQFDSINIAALAICILTGFLSVIWYEAVKFFRRMSD
jgi:Ca2+-transporting ATPase